MDGRGLQGARSARVVIRPEDLQGAARLLTRVSDPRAAVCLAASWMLRADVAELWEPGPEGVVLAASTEEDRFSRSPRRSSTAGAPPRRTADRFSWRPYRAGGRPLPRCWCAGAGRSTRSTRR